MRLFRPLSLGRLNETRMNILFLEEGMDINQMFSRLLKELRRERFTGFVRINFDSGTVERIEKNEEISKKMRA